MFHLSACWTKTRPCTSSEEHLLHAEYDGEYERRDDARVTFDDELRRVHLELAPRDLFVGNGAGIGAIARGRIGDLAEVSPDGNVLPLQILVEHGNDADRKVAGDAAADLE